MRLLAIVGLVAALWAAPTAAQAPCLFVLGFADMRDLLGPAVVGPCLENQRTLTEFERFDLGGGIVWGLPAGMTIQRTQHGLLKWEPAGNFTQFYTAAGVWDRVGDGKRFRTWSEAGVPAQPDADRSPTSIPAGADALHDARLSCVHAATGWMTVTLGTSLTAQQRAALEADGDAKGYLCEQALNRDGPKGVACFLDAWDAATGMERVFPGSGRQVYDEKYATCLAGR